MAKELVIVESPAKAKTVGQILGRRYSVKASLGHVRDLPEKRLGVDVKNGFAPQYVIPKQKRPLVQELKEAAENAVAIYLATDPDREGEAISWHIVEAAELNGGKLPGRFRLLKGVDVTNAEALTRAEIQLRREGFRALMHLREHMPGYENARVSLTWPP